MEYYDKISKQLDDLLEKSTLKYPSMGKKFAMQIRIAAIAEDRDTIKELCRDWIAYEK